LGICFFFRQVGHRNVRALPCERNRDGAADARVTAGDQGLAARESSRTDVSLFTVIRSGVGPAGQPRLLLFLLGKVLGPVLLGRNPMTTQPADRDQVGTLPDLPSA